MHKLIFIQESGTFKADSITQTKDWVLAEGIFLTDPKGARKRIEVPISSLIAFVEDLDSEVPDA